MANNNDDGNFWVYGFLIGACGYCWFFIFDAFFYFGHASMDEKANLIFFAIIFALFSYSDHLFADLMTESEILLVAPVAGILFTVFLYFKGFSDGSEITNLLFFGFWAIISTFSFGVTVKALINYAALFKRKLYDYKMYRQHLKYNRDNSHDDAANDSRFDYDESAFDGSGNQNDNKETPYGWEKRHPKDATLWAVVDDPSASDNEREIALRKILERQRERNGQPSKDIATAGE